MEEHAEKTEKWRKKIRDWYPKLDSKTYVCPPLYFRQTSPPDTAYIGKEKVNIPKEEAAISPYIPQIKGSESQEWALKRIQSLGKINNEVMMVISQLDYSNKHNKKCIASSAKRLKGIDGDFDILILHRKNFVVIGEVKSVSIGGMTTDKSFSKAIEQLNNAKQALCQSDIQEEKIIKTLILPSITSSELGKFLEEKTKLSEALEKCLNCKPNTKVVDLILCHDTPENHWWEQLIGDKSKNEPMTLDEYETIVYRFCGPKITIPVFLVKDPRVKLELRSEGHAVAATGDRMVELWLYRKQFELVCNNERLVFLTGPPGTGKTIVLLLKGLKWLLDKHDVQLVSTWNKSPAAAYLLQHQMEKTFKNSTGSTESSSCTAEIFLHRFNFLKETEVKRALTELSYKEKNGCLHIIVDEPGPDMREEALQLFVKHEGDYKRKLSMTSAVQFFQKACRMSPEDAQNTFLEYAQDSHGFLNLEKFQLFYTSEKNKHKKNSFEDFCKRLYERFSEGLYLWAGAIETHIKPSCLQQEELTVPLRSPPRVLQEVEKSTLISKGIVLKYTSPTEPALTDGNDIKYIYHGNPDHAKVDLLNDCMRCGEEIADYLDKELHLGREEAVKSRAPYLKLSDVFVLCDRPIPACNLVQGLRKKFSVRVVERGADDDEYLLKQIQDTALATTDKITVSHHRHVHGLESKVVVWAGNMNWDNEYNRMYDMSRCTSQLVLIENSPKNNDHLQN